MRGRLLQIERLCVHDGPGIRTTVYLKGCSLQCLWCHNPESISPRPEIGFRERKCIGCGKCAEGCPAGVHVFDGGVHRLEREHCLACGACVEACLPGALEYYGTEVSASEIADAVLADTTFYVKSGGGCTISGGEPLLQADFCAEVFRLVGEHGVHCAIDTSGAVKWESIETVLPVTDTFLYDLKHVDDRRHRDQTGSSSELVLSNLRRLSACNIPIEIRIPTIPGFNADEQSMAAMGEFLGRLSNIIGVRLLPYHLARQKYEIVGRPDTMPDVPLPDADAIAVAARVLRRFGLQVAE